MPSPSTKLITRHCPKCHAASDEFVTDWESMYKVASEKLAQREVTHSRLIRDKRQLVALFDEYLDDPDMEDELMDSLINVDEDNRIRNVLTERRKRDKKRIAKLEKEVEKLKAASELERKKNSHQPLDTNPRPGAFSPHGA